VAGDFFADPLPKADVIIMGHISHDWAIDRKRTLLSKAFELQFYFSRSKSKPALSQRSNPGQSMTNAQTSEPQQAPREQPTCPARHATAFLQRLSIRSLIRNLYAV